MATYTFHPPPHLHASILSAGSTTAKVSFSPADIFVDAKLIPPLTRNGIQYSDNVPWTVEVQTVPNPIAHPQERATLHITRGELGKVLASISLGDARLNGTQISEET
jgi:hypothetical protein